MGDKRKKKRTAKKTNWENIRSWVGAILCIAIIIAAATYVAKLVPSSSAYNPPGPVNVAPSVTGTTALAKITFSKPVQITGNLTDPFEFDYGFGRNHSDERVEDVYGDAVLFQRYLPENYGTSDVFVYNLATKKLTQINLPTQTVAWPNSLRIWNDIVAYEYDQNIYINRVIDGNEPIAITHDLITEGYYIYNIDPAIYGNVIVWSRSEGWSPYGLWMADINRLQDGSKRVTKPTSPFNKISPRIFDNVIVWADYTTLGYEHGSWDCMPENPDARSCSEIHICDLKNDYNPFTYCNERSITNDSVVSNAAYPDIYGGRYGTIVWVDDINHPWNFGTPPTFKGKMDAFMYDFKTGQTTKVASLADDIAEWPRPSIYERFVSYWMQLSPNYSSPEYVLYDASSLKEYAMQVLIGFSYPPYSFLLAGDTGGKQFINNKGPFNIVLSYKENMYWIKAQSM